MGGEASTAQGTVARADARRNYETLLGAARAAFAEHGTEASLRDVARRAGVGIGTLYRHFPTRDALLEALLHTGFESLRASAEALATSPDPAAALVTWLGELATGSSAYQGLPASVLAALRDEGSRLHASCEAMRAAAAGLLERARQAGAVRSDVSVGDALALAAAIAWAAGQVPEDPDIRARLLAVMAAGLAPTP